MIAFPVQRLSYKEKIADDYKWGRQVIDYLATNRNVKDYKRKKRNYDIFNNVLNQEDFERECNPLGLEVGQVKDMIQPYNKTYNKIQVLLGEELKRPFNFTAYISDSEGIRQKNIQKTEMLKSWLVNKIKEYELSIRSKMQVDADTQEEIDAMQKQIKAELDKMVSPDDIEKHFKTSFLDSKEIMSNKLLNYLFKKLYVKDIKNDSFKHALLSGEEGVWVGIRKGRLCLEVLNSLGFFYHKNADTKFIQDGLYAGYKRYMSAQDVLDTYGDELTDEQVERVAKYGANAFQKDHGFSEGQTIHTAAHEMYLLQHGDNLDAAYEQGSTQYNQFLVTHVEWKSQRKVGFLSIKGKDGSEEETLVSEEFIIPKNATKKSFKEYNAQKTVYYWTDFNFAYELEWKWIPEVWEGTRIGHDIYVCIKPKEEQYFSIDDPYKVELGYKGVSYSSMNSNSISLMDRMIPFYYLYVIAAHKMKQMIAKDMGKALSIDLTQIDPTLGLDKTLFYLKELNIDFYNPLHNADKPGSAQRGKVMEVKDLSNMQAVNHYLLLMDKIDMHLSDVAGISRQREGQTSVSQAVTTAQQDLAQSSIVTEIYFHLHNILWQRTLTSLLSTARKYYSKYKKKHIQYVLDDMSYETIELDKDLLEENEMNVFLIDSVKENEVFMTLKSLAQPLIQNDKARFSDVITLLEANSIVQLKRNIKHFEDKQMEMAQQQQEFQAKMASDAADKAFQMKMAIEQHITDRELAKAEIDVFKFQKDLDANNNGTPDPLEIEALKLKVRDSDRKHELEEKKLSLKEKELQIKKTAKKTND